MDSRNPRDRDAVDAERLLLALEGAEQGTWDDDRLTGAISWDARTYRLFGVPEGTPVTYQKILDEYVHPEDRHLLEAAPGAALDPEGNGKFNVEHRIRGANGDIRWLIAQGQTLFSETPAGRRPVRIVGVVRDITARKEAEQLLIESETRLRRVFDSIDEGYCVCEIVLDTAGKPVDYRFIEINRLFEDMTGLRDAQGRCAYEMLPGLEPFWLDTYARVALGGETLRFEQGSATMGRYFDVFATPLTPRGRFALVFKDVTARKAAEIALRESEQRASRILEATSDGFITVDADWTIAYVNRRGQEIVSPITTCDIPLVGRNFWEAFPEVVGTPFDECFRRAAREQASVSAEAFYPPLDTWFMVRAYPSSHGIAIHFVDIGDRKRAEKERDLLLGELHHRMNNTFAVIQALARQSFHGNEAAREASREFLDRLSALAAAHQSLTVGNWEQVSLSDLATKILQLDIADAARVQLDGPHVLLGPKQALSLSMALHELATNSLKYGALRSRVGKVAVEWHTDQPNAGDFTMFWRESGGPAIEPPQRRGFGTRMIEQVLSIEFGGSVEMDFRPEGLACTLKGRLRAGA